MIHIRAALHELRCAECRVTWGSWFQRLVGDKRGYSPKPPTNGDLIGGMK